jgi:tricorn protease
MTSPRSLVRAAVALATAALAAGTAAAQTKLLRFPDVHGERVAFCYAGDIWTAPAGGGTATRVTAHPGQELFPRFSPDGKSIAFTGQYDGDEQVYVVPAVGGFPKQLTFYPAAGPLPPRWGYDNQVYGWTADGKRVLYRSLRDAFDLTDSKLYTVAVDGEAQGGLPEQLPLPYVGAADLSPDGAQIVYSPLVRDFRTWKRYAGGWAQDLWIFDFASHDARRITDDPRADRDPMWIGGAIYFTSDRSGTNNLYRYDVASAKTAQVTQESTWDLRWPATDHRGRIVFELDGELELLDVASGERKRLAIDVPHDGLWERPAVVDCAGHVEDYSLSPKGERALFSARGEIFSAPVEHGTTYDLTETPGAHERAARWSPDGKKILYVSDQSGEDELYLADAPGTGAPGAAPVQLTHMGPGYRQNPLWSPDGKRIAFSDQNQKLYVYELESYTFREVADDPMPFGLEYVWSPDGRWIAYSLTDRNEFRSIWLWSVDGGDPRRLTDELWNEFSPAWDPEGEYLYFLADRDFAPQLDSIEWNFTLNRKTSVFAIALREDVPHPAPPRNDAVTPDEPDETGEAEAAKGDGAQAKDEEAPAEKDAAKEPLRIDLDGIERRVARLPIDADNLGGLSAVEGHVVFMSSPASYYGRDGERTTRLQIYSLEKRETKTLFEDANGYDLSADGKKLVVSSGGFHVLDAKPGAESDKKTVSTAGLRALRDPRAEWQQIFWEVWRRYRDFFYVDNMHGYDWKALGGRYAAWLPHVAHRSDLNYLIGEMIAELNVGHAYIAGGEYEIPPRPRAALLGARLELDPAAGRYRVARILPGQNEEPRYRSPLTEVGVGVEVGDYVLAIDGRPLEAADNPEAVLREKGGRPLQLLVNRTPDASVEAGARTVTVDPIANEDALLYLEWVLGCRERVDELSGGRVGYLHIPDMGSEGIYEFIKWYYGQLDKEGLVVDARSNGGGNVSPMIMERLLRKIAGYDFERNRDFAEAQPGKAFGGRLVALCDEDTASDGDQFSWYFKNAGLGELVGKRTWGGVVGIYGRAPLMDGGSAFVPEAGTCDVSGQWAVEGYGVDPTIAVENDAKSLLAGHDPQLERAVAEVLADIRERPVVVPKKPAGPVKTK